jgi:Electron transfer DM13
MNLRTVLLAFLILFFAACKKENTPDNASENLPAGTTLVTGSFVSNAHTTGGTVKVIQDPAGKRHLVFENFRTDNGPDLRVWVAPTTTGASYQEIGLLKAVNGNFSYELSTGINYTTHNRVLIWCEDFSVLFGHAVLQ